MGNQFYQRELDLRIQWKARFPPFYFGKGSETSWTGHFEQSGNINGEAKLPDGRKITIVVTVNETKAGDPETGI